MVEAEDVEVAQDESETGLELLRLRAQASAQSAREAGNAYSGRGDPKTVDHCRAVRHGVKDDLAVGGALEVAVLGEDVGPAETNVGGLFGREIADLRRKANQ